VGLMTHRITLHLRAVQSGEDAMGEPIYDPPQDVDGVPAWWEMAGSVEDVAAAEQVLLRYWLYTEDTRITAADQVTLHGVVDVRCDLAPPQHQPSGFVVDGYTRVLVTAVSG
jgi:hypothetical protein